MSLAYEYSYDNYSPTFLELFRNMLLKQKKDFALKNVNWQQSDCTVEYMYDHGEKE